ncbi:MAG: ABC transporter ATP-binding protein [Chthoniobacterales bacterium]|nr:ABC transporter ATP-binding protein [Chthoniobacterales bacterium]
MLSISVENLSKRYQLGMIDRKVLLREIAWFLKGREKRSQAAPEEAASEFWALKDVNFQIREGETVGIIGANGAGKSTLLKILSRITSPTTGTVRINGRVGSLLEVGTGFNPEMTGRENVYLNGAIQGMKRPEIDAKFDSVVSFAGVEKFIDTPVKRYSSGMYVRLAFSVAAFLESEILIVDEVLSVGDQQFQNRCIQRLQEIIRDGRTVLFVSHGAGQVRKLCTRAICLQRGEVICDDETNKALEKYQAAQREAAGIFGSWKSTASQSEVVFQESERPGDDIVKLISCRLVNAAGTIVEKVATSEGFRLEFDYEVHQGGHPLRPACIVSDELGNILFWTGDAGLEARNVPVARGHYSAHLEFPGRFFSPGRLLFTFGVGGDTETGDSHALANDALSILVEDDMNDLVIRGAYKGSLPGFFRPLLKWTTKEVLPTDRQ